MDRPNVEQEVNTTNNMEAVIWADFSVTFKDDIMQIVTTSPFKDRDSAVKYCEENCNDGIEFIVGTHETNN